VAAGQAGWDRPDAATLRLSLLRSPAVFRKFRHQGIQDHGMHELELALVRHHSAASTEAHSRRLQQPPLARAVTRHGGPLGRSVSLLELDAGVVARAVKRAEDGEGLIVRVQETDGVARETRVRAAATVRSASQLDGCEVARRRLEPAGDGLELDLGPFALRTVRLDLAPPPTAVEAPAWTHLEIPFDTRAASRQGEQGVRFGASGHSFPAELWPESLRVGAVPFRLGPAGGLNALEAAGQVFEWTVEAGVLHLLAATVDRPASFRLGVGERSISLAVDRWDGLLGCWKGWRRGPRHLRWARPGGGFERRDRLGWVSGHRHDAAGADDPYAPGYLFRYRVDLPAGARRLVLPRSRRLALFAATLA
jgi:alpha-mannosidase